MRARLRLGASSFLLLAACATNGGPPDAALDAGSDDGLRVVEGCPTATDDVPHAAPHTPRWAFEPWISKDISSTDDTYAFVKGFEERDIPVGVVVLDSPWETHYNTFVPHPVRYHDFQKLSTDLHAKNIRLVLWITQMVNSSGLDLEAGGDKYEGAAANYAEGLRCGFYVNGGENYVWWKGTGAGLDFFHPHAVAWWHRQQDTILPYIDGWKLDFGESYILAREITTGTGTRSFQEYSEAYYRDFRDYGVSARGRDFVTMVRGWDQSYRHVGRFHARPEDAPIAWAGDNRRDTIGFADALHHVFKSSRAGYVAAGSDLGGYLDLDDVTFEKVEPDWDVFARWTAVSALSPFMQLHGRANLTPWTVPDRAGHDGEVVALYRYWSTLHHELVPFLYSLAEASYEAKPGDPAWQPILRPIGDEASWAGDFRYLLGDAILVAPLLDGERGTHTRDVELPDGASWLDLWDLAGGPLPGGAVLPAYDRAVERPRVPVFLRRGAIVPMEVASDVTGAGTAASKGALTIWTWPAPVATRFVVHEADDSTIEVTAVEEGAAGARRLRVGISRSPRPIVLRVQTPRAARSVSDGATPVPALADRAAALGAASGWAPDAGTAATWIRLPASPGAREVTIPLAD